MARRSKKKNTPSSITRLPKEIREEIRRLRLEQSATIDEILAHLRKFEVAVSRSALGRHTKSLDEMMQYARESRVVAEAIVNKFGEEPDDKVARANLELLQSALLRLQMAAHDAMHEEPNDDGTPRDFPFTPKDILQLSTAVQRLASASKTTDDRIRAAQEHMRKEAILAVDRVAKKNSAGLSKETVEDIKREILGIKA